MSENPREIVLDTLLVMEREKEFSHKLIKAVLDKYDYLESRDKAFIKRTCEGTIERKIELDYYLNYFSSVPVNKMKPLIRCLMRMSVYQLVYMDQIPDSAVCNEACKLAAKRKFVNLKGFVNGVLRNIAKNKDKLPMPEQRKNSEEYLSVKYSMPLWIVKKWIREYGADKTLLMLEGIMQIHPVTFRFDSRLSKEELYEAVDNIVKAGVELKQSDLLPYSYEAFKVDGIERLPGYSEGLFTIQDISSSLCVEAAGIKTEDTVLDICAAPGGKTLLASEKCKRVISRDVSDIKVDLISENAARMGRINIETQVADATVFDENMVETADVLIADVPCSGLGVMGKKRDIKYNVTEEGLEEIVKLQRKILENSYRYVKVGGTLMYSTCTVNPEENENQVKWICENLPFEMVENGSRLFLPGLDNSDGFFYAKLIRKA